MVNPAELIARAKEGRIKAIRVGGVDLHTRKFSLPEVLEIQRRHQKGDEVEPHEYLAIGLCHEDGSPYFTLDQAREFAEADGALAAMISDVVLDHAGLTVAAQERLAKN